MNYLDYTKSISSENIEVDCINNNGEIKRFEYDKSLGTIIEKEKYCTTDLNTNPKKFVWCGG